LLFIIDFHKPASRVSRNALFQVLCFGRLECSLILHVIKFEFAFWKKKQLRGARDNDCCFITVDLLLLSLVVCHEMTPVIGMLFH
jgi:hypothetical protein